VQNLTRFRTSSNFYVE